MEPNQCSPTSSSSSPPPTPLSPFTSTRSRPYGHFTAGKLTVVLLGIVALLLWFTNFANLNCFRVHRHEECVDLFAMFLVGTALLLAFLLCVSMLLLCKRLYCASSSPAEVRPLAKVFENPMLGWERRLKRDMVGGPKHLAPPIVVQMDKH